MSKAGLLERRPPFKIQTSYDEDYFENGVQTGKSLYENYRWLPELTVPMCEDLAKQLKIRRYETILDFGCAKGFMVKGLREVGMQAWGYDTSEYALSFMPDRHKSTPWKFFDWVISKDTFEHMTPKLLDATLSRLRCKNIFVVVPLGDGQRYIEPEYEKDITHVIRENLSWWNKKIGEHFRIWSATYTFGNLKRNRDRAPMCDGFIWGYR